MMWVIQRISLLSQPYITGALYCYPHVMNDPALTAHRDR
jgi:hypothetical protein